MLWQFIQLFPMDVVDEFAGPDSIPIPGITQLLYAFRFLKTLLFGLFDWGDMLLFFASIALVFFSFFLFIWNLITNGCGWKDSRIKISWWFQILLFDVLYISLLESLFSMFTCTYTCRYDPADPPSDPYPPYTIYPAISCSSPQHITLFSLGVLAVVFYHFRASQFIVYEESKTKERAGKDDAADDNESYAPDHFRYAECMLRVCAFISHNYYFL